jgi:hypothetical protein
VCQTYSTELLSQINSVKSAWLRFLYIEKPHDDPEKETKRQTLIATLWEGLPPVTETEATQFARLPPPKVIPKTPAKRLQWRRRYQEALPFIRKTWFFLGQTCFTVWRMGDTKKLLGAIVDMSNTTKHQGGTDGSASW